LTSSGEQIEITPNTFEQMEDKEPAFNSQAVVEDEDCGDEEYPGTLVALMILVIVIIVSVIAI